MRSFVKNFRFELVALLIVVLIEAHTYYTIGWEKIKQSQINNLFQKNFMTFDVGQKYIVRYKHDIFYDMKPEFVQVGDSSGAYSVRPELVKKYLGGKDYIDTNCCADTGWDGYNYIAEHFLENNEKAEYLVLYITPYSMPMQYKEGFSGELKKIFASKKENPFQIVNYIPSLYYRPEVLNIVYSEETEAQDAEYERVMNNLGIYKPTVQESKLDLKGFLKKTNGWAPYHPKPLLKEMPVGACGPRMMERFFSDDKKPTLGTALEKMKKVAIDNNVKLIIMFNPVACTDSAEITPIKQDLELFKKNNPDVIVPFDLITTYKPQDFSDEWHLTPEASIKNSERVGKALEKILSSEKPRKR